MLLISRQFWASSYEVGSLWLAKMKKFLLAARKISSLWFGQNLGLLIGYQQIGSSWLSAEYDEANVPGSNNIDSLSFKNKTLRLSNLILDPNKNKKVQRKLIKKDLMIESLFAIYILLVYFLLKAAFVFVSKFVHLLYFIISSITDPDVFCRHITNLNSTTFNFLRRNYLNCRIAFEKHLKFTMSFFYTCC